jgi:anti-sigma factor RsiW
MFANDLIMSLADGFGRDSRLNASEKVLVADPRSAANGAIWTRMAY